MSRVQAMHANSLKAFEMNGPRLSARAQAVLDWITAHGPHTDRGVMQGMGFTEPNQVRPRITELVDLGLIEEHRDVTCPVTGATVRLVGLPRIQKELFS
jgi:hypothetical protein